MRNIRLSTVSVSRRSSLPHPSPPTTLEEDTRSGRPRQQVRADRRVQTAECRRAVLVRSASALAVHSSPIVSLVVSPGVSRLQPFRYHPQLPRQQRVHHVLCERSLRVFRWFSLLSQKVCFRAMIADNPASSCRGR